MNYRLATILAHEAINTAGTKTVDITLKDLISRITVQIKATNNGPAPTAHPATIVSKIELVNGSDVLFGLSGKEALAMDFFDTGITPFVINNYLDDVMNVVAYNLNFGRFLWDPVLALDPKKFNALQLKITHNLALGGSAPDACTLEAVAYVFDEKAAEPAGFLMKKETVSYTLSASANEYIDLPTDYSLRKLLIMSHADDKMPHEQFNEVKLSEDNDRRVPINDLTSDLMKYFNSLWPRLTEYIEGAALTTTRDFYVMSAYEIELSAIAMGFGAAYLTSDYMYGGQIDIRGSVAANFKAVVTGLAPFGSLALPFGNQSDHADWYNLSKLGSLRLTLKAGSSPGALSTCQVCTEQLRTYSK